MTNFFNPSSREKISNRLSVLSNSILNDSYIVFMDYHKKLLDLIKNEFVGEKNKVAKEILIRSYICFKELLPPLLLYGKGSIRNKISTSLLDLSLFKNLPDLYKKLEKFVGVFSSTNEIGIINLAGEKINFNKSPIEIIDNLRNTKYKNKFKVYLYDLMKFIETYPKATIFTSIIFLLLMSILFPNSSLNEIIKNYFTNK
jgi:hypothetical protein